MSSAGSRIERVTARAFTVPTDAPEADGTIAWDSTTMVLVEAAAGGETGLGYSYSHASIAPLIEAELAPRIVGGDAHAVPGHWQTMLAVVRNLGWPGLAACAVSAVDTALWDLKARLSGLPLATLLGPIREAVPIYGSGGFTTYDDARLERQLGGWARELGCRWVKMKIGSEPSRDLDRAKVALAAIGDAELMVDANGALSRKTALWFAERFAELGVTWFEEPVSSDDLDGLRVLRDEGPAGLEVAAGEYGYDLFYFRRMLAAGAVDVLQADATRCGGYTGFLRAAALCDAFGLPLSAHTAPALHLHACCAAPRLRHVEWFHDHARIEAMLFDGAPQPADGVMRPDLSRPGLGLSLRREQAERYAV
jgi:L-alanine-DL-glutamate epimerase-like enolase superfamily enzyme